MPDRKPGAALLKRPPSPDERAFMIALHLVNSLAWALLDGHGQRDRDVDPDDAPAGTAATASPTATTELCPCSVCHNAAGVQWAAQHALAGIGNVIASFPALEDEDAARIAVEIAKVLDPVIETPRVEPTPEAE